MIKGKEMLIQDISKFSNLELI